MTCPGGISEEIMNQDVGHYISTETFELHPIGFVSPNEDVLQCVPEKARYLSAIDPANRETYIYGVQDEL